MSFKLIYKPIAMIYYTLILIQIYNNTLYFKDTSKDISSFCNVLLTLEEPIRISSAKAVTISDTRKLNRYFCACIWSRWEKITFDQSLKMR